MMDWTDRHCRFFLRQISRHTRLYTEMVTAPALILVARKALAAYLVSSADSRDTNMTGEPRSASGL